LDATRTDVRELPKNIEAEQVVLGAAILEPESTVPIIIEKLSPEDFYERKHRIIFRTIKDLFALSEPSDIILLANRLEETGDMERAGGRMYLNELLDRTTTTASLEYFADIIKRKAMLRNIVEIGGRISEKGYDERSEISEVVNAVEMLLFNVTSDRQNKNEAVLLSDRIITRIADLEKIHSTPGQHAITGLETGIIELDELTSGLQKSDLIIVAGRPSVGKSSLATTIATHTAIKDAKKVLIFSLEMKTDAVLDRIISCAGSVNLHMMKTGRLDNNKFRMVTHAGSLISETTIIVDDSPGISIMEIQARARRL